MTDPELGVALAAILTAIAGGIATLYKTVINPAIITLRTTMSEMQDRHSLEMKTLKDEKDTQIREMREDYEQKITAIEARYELQIAKMDDEYLKCVQEREQAFLWRARYEERLRQLERATLEGKVTARPDESGVLTIVTVNIAMSKIFGYTRSELIGMKVEDLISPKDRAKHIHKIKERNIGELKEINKEFNRVINGGIAKHKDGHHFRVTVELESTLINGQPGWTAIITQE